MRSTADKVNLFAKRFTGLTHVWGTYEPSTGRTRQVKEPVTNKVLLNHLTGKNPYGVYLLVNDKTKAVVIDLDTQDRLAVTETLNAAKHYGIQGYVECSKSKGYHIWFFTEEEGFLAAKARLVFLHILSEIELSAELFPKQDKLLSQVQYGNFINAPLFGALVPKGKTVFVDPVTFEPFKNQWDVLESVDLLQESTLDDVIEMNNLMPASKTNHKQPDAQNSSRKFIHLPPCAQKMLQEGVSQFQRVSCFTLAVSLKTMGLPQDLALSALRTWAKKNKPHEHKKIISDVEITAQVEDAFQKNYSGHGCNSDAVRPFCESTCGIYKFIQKNKIGSVASSANETAPDAVRQE